MVSVSDENLIGRCFYSDFKWLVALVAATLFFAAFAIRWIYIDRSPPAWDQSLYLYQATTVHENLVKHGISDFLRSVFNVDRGRVPLVLILAQPAFLIFGPSLAAAAISLSFAWILFAWSFYGIAQELVVSGASRRAAFLAFVLFGAYPLTILLARNYLVDMLLAALVCCSIYSLLILSRTGAGRWSVLSGIFIGLGMLTKVTFPAFIFPGLIFLIFSTMRRNGFFSALRTYSWAILLIVVIAGPYYFYNFNQILNLTASLSSGKLAQLYGFDLGFWGLVGYWRELFDNFSIIASFLFVAVLLFVSLANWRSRRCDSDLDFWTDARIVCVVWFVVPFVIASLGQIKDPRYAYPGLMPIFIFSGISAAHIFHTKIGRIGVGVIFSILVLSILSSGGFMNLAPVTRVISALYPGWDAHQFGDAPDVRDWKVDQITKKISDEVGASDAARNILFLGGDRNYHINLFNYSGLCQGLNLSYAALPYYQYPSMSLDDALDFIRNLNPDGIIFKTGRNWPPFSSRLDDDIMARLEMSGRYRYVDLMIEQPDKSRFILLVSRKHEYVDIYSVSEILGNWMVAGGVAKIEKMENGKISILTEAGARGVGEIDAGKIVVPDWHVTGRLSADLGSIYWSNGSIWMRSKL